MNVCTLAKENCKIILNCLKNSFILRPLLFISIVLIAPGVDTAMFYFNSNILKFTPDEFGTIGVIT
jgi:hypothetical protein